MENDTTIHSQLHTSGVATWLESALQAQRLSGSTVHACASDTFSGALPTVAADAVNNLTVVPVTNINSASLVSAAAAAALAATPQFFSSPQQQQQQQQQSQLQQPIAALCNRRRLLLTQAPHECPEAVVQAWLTNFGPVEQLQAYADAGAVLGSNCFLVTMGTSEGAAAVVAAVLSNIQLPAIFLKLSVSWVVQSADQSAVLVDGQTMSSALACSADRTLFFAKVPPTAAGSEVEALFGSFGKLAEVNLFRAWAGAKHSKGCGLITFKDRSSAAAAISQLHGEFIFPGSDCPMVVEWVDLKKQRTSAVSPSVDKPPMGCACDAYKLLLSNIPVGVIESMLINMLSQFGPVVQLGLSHNLPGPCTSGHLWYATKQAADALVARSKSDIICLRDPRTNHDLPLSVKKVRKPGPHNSCSSSTTRSNVTATLSTTSTNTNSSSFQSFHRQLTGLQVVAPQHSQEGHTSSTRVPAVAAGLGNSGSLDSLGTLQSSGVLRMLPLQQHTSTGLLSPAAAVMLQGNAVSAALMTLDMCEALPMDFCDSVRLGMSTPVQLQPAVVSQMTTVVSSAPTAPSHLYCLPSGLTGSTSGQQCMSLPANIQGIDQFEGSFNMLSLPGGAPSHMLRANGLTHAQGKLHGSMPLSQQHMAQKLQQQLVQQQWTGMVQVGGVASIFVPIHAYELQPIAQHLSFLSSQTGAQFTITTLPGGGLAVMISGQQEQVAVAQSLLASARN